MNHLDLIVPFAAPQQGVVTLEQCRVAGIGPDWVKALCRSHEWMRLHEGVYFVAAYGSEPPRRAQIWAALLSAGPGAVAVLATAAELHGLAGLSRDDSVHVSLPGSVSRPQRYAGTAPRRDAEPGVRLHQLSLGRGDCAPVDGIPATTPVRTVANVLLRVDRFTGVSLLDSALNRRILLPEDLERVRASMRGRRGAVRARPWLDEADDRAESPLETRVRLRAADGGVAPEELQFRVRDPDGTIVAIADLAWVGARVVGEADGVEAHDNPTALFRDRKRQNDIIAAGFVPVRFCWADTLTPDYVPQVIRSAIARSARDATQGSAIMS